mgnify:CR=1 FL=1
MCSGEIKCMMESEGKILLLLTGGTICSFGDEQGNRRDVDIQKAKALLLQYFEESDSPCAHQKFEVVTVLNTLSENMTIPKWNELLRFFKKCDFSQYRGIVIAHGTDTMAYTAAALSYMVQNTKKPIVITGAQKPIDLEITDAKSNLIDSFLYAADDRSQGVQIVFDGKVIAGTRAKKVRSKSYNAFSSIDYPSLAVIQDMNIMRYIPMLPYEEEVRFYEKLDENVFLMKLIPGIRPKVLKSIFENYDCIIVESFGVGGIPQSIAEEFYRLCQEHPDKLVVMATQVAHEGSDMTVYEVGHNMKEYCRFLESYDMTLESVIAKVMWMLGNYDISSCDIEEVFYHSINYDLIFGKNRKCN